MEEENVAAKKRIMESLQKRLKRDEDEYVKRWRRFNQFDVIMNDDHLSVLGDADVHCGEDFRTKKIMVDWRILKERLPRTIFVKGYKSLKDRLRAVIVGEAGTPFHDGLFFFDIEFPSSYPYKPPVVRYHSYGFRLHPDLEWDGTVRLSLLNTSRKKNTREKYWSTDSNVLEVLVSIQKHIMNSKPYLDSERILPKWFYNTEKKSLAYNQKAFVLNCKTMLEVMHKPPKDFEFFVAQHFRDRADTILSACLAYKKGQKVGAPFPILPSFSSTLSSASLSTLSRRHLLKSSNRRNSKFRTSINVLYSRFYQAFLQMGLRWSTLLITRSSSFQSTGSITCKLIENS
ncbi:hypothetical protein MKW94_007849 [Papaver nudicaule]|uniref:UBC core domain-containing protein n=1 Tax=Papaver nudicaule TaxID=74823 RepID=A0AA41VUH3_PAPNU|nr:hypothetical protein [Papaver nudicaule]